jgi:hypothetical protein
MFSTQCIFKGTYPSKRSFIHMVKGQKTYHFRHNGCELVSEEAVFWLIWSSLMPPFLQTDSQMLVGCLRTVDRLSTLWVWVCHVRGASWEEAVVCSLSSCLLRFCFFLRFQLKSLVKSIWPGLIFPCKMVITGVFYNNWLSTEYSVVLAICLCFLGSC